MITQERAIANSFVQAPQPFSGAIGAIDCTHINIFVRRYTRKHILITMEKSLNKQ